MYELALAKEAPFTASSHYGQLQRQLHEAGPDENHPLDQDTLEQAFSMT